MIIAYIIAATVAVMALWTAAGVAFLLAAGARHYRRSDPAEVFPVHMRARVCSTAARTGCVATVRQRIAPCSWAWYMAEPVSSSELITGSGWALTGLGIDRRQHRAATHMHQQEPTGTT